MKNLNQVMNEAAEIASGSSGTNYDHVDRKLAGLIEAVAYYLAETRDRHLSAIARAYEAGQRDAWQDGPSFDESMRGLLDQLCNADAEPGSAAYKALLK